MVFFQDDSKIFRVYFCLFYKHSIGDVYTPAQLRRNKSTSSHGRWGA